MKKIIYNKVVGIAFLAILFTQAAYSQNERNKALIYSYLHGWEYSIKAGFSIGGTSPLPLPKEIRNIDSYAPNVAISIEGNTTKWFGNDKKMGNDRRYTPRKQNYDNRSYRKELWYEDYQH